MAYHTKASSKVNVYHACKNCHLGNNIKAGNLGKGKPAWAIRLCINCARLQEKGQCTLGAPIPAEGGIPPGPPLNMPKMRKRK